MPSHPLHNDDVLQKMIEHIHYEVWMVNWCCEQLPVLREDSRKRTECLQLYNTVGEGFLIHFRQLREFFMADSPWPRDNDVYAWEFSFEPSQFSYGRGVQLRSKEVQKVSRRVAHITTDRIEKTEHDAGEMLIALKDAYEEWSASLAPKWKGNSYLEDAGKRWISYHRQPMINQGRTVTSSGPFTSTVVTFETQDGE